MENNLVTQEQENSLVPQDTNTGLVEESQTTDISNAARNIKIPDSFNIEEFFEKLLKTPGIRIDRNDFLKKLFAKLSNEDKKSILELGPIEAGVSREDLKKIAKKLVIERTVVSTSASFLAGIPGGAAMAATIPADIIQFFVISLRLAQELAYLYGQQDMWDENLDNQEEIKMKMVLYCGVMLGANSASAAVRALSSTLAKQALKKLPGMALTKTMIYPLVKGVSKAVGITMTKKVFAEGVAKVVPVVGGVVSGGLTLASMLPMGLKLADTLDKANFDYTEEEFNKDIETIQNAGEEHISHEEKLQVKELVSQVKGKMAISPEKQKEWAEGLKKVKEKITIKHDSQTDWTEELKKAKDLFDSGILSEEEFADLKSKILAKF